MEEEKWIKRKFVADLKDGEYIRELFAVKFKKPIKPYEKGFYFEIRVSDRTGEITVKFWGGKDKEKISSLYTSFDKGDVIFLTGLVTRNKDVLEIQMDENEILKKVSEGNYNLEDFIGFTKKDIEEMKKELFSFINEVKEPFLRKLLESFFKDEKFMNEFIRAPAAMHYHQNYVGGLLEHTLNVTKIAKFIHSLHPKLNLDLLITGALLHDVGKIKEFEMNTSIDVSREGMLIGHIVLGKDMVKERIEKIEGFPKELELKVLHLILSHHGKNIFGSPKEPQLPEAMAIHLADEIDAKLDLMIRFKEEARTEDPWIWTKQFGHIYLE